MEVRTLKEASTVICKASGRRGVEYKCSLIQHPWNLSEGFVLDQSLECWEQRLKEEVQQNS